jgi:hypothetical protein
MRSYSEYYRQRLTNQKYRIRELYVQLKYPVENITGKKRSFEEAMGFPNDYEVVTNPETYLDNRGENWVDSYIENIKQK